MLTTLNETGNMKRIKYGKNEFRHIFELQMGFILIHNLIKFEEQQACRIVKVLSTDYYQLNEFFTIFSFLLFCNYARIIKKLIINVYLNGKIRNKH